MFSHHLWTLGSRGSVPIATWMSAFLCCAVRVRTTWKWWGTPQQEIAWTTSKTHIFCNSCVPVNAANHNAAQLHEGYKHKSYTASGPKSLTLPVDLSLTLPVDLSLTLPVDLSLTMPVDLSLTLPVDLSLTMPVDLCLTLPVDLCLTMPVDLSLTMPVDLSLTLPVDLSLKMPVDLSLTLPVDLSLTMPVDLSLLPVDLSLTLPVDCYKQYFCTYLVPGVVGELDLQSSCGTHFKSISTHAPRPTNTLHPTAPSGGRNFIFSAVQAMAIISDLAWTNLEIADEFHIKTRPLVTAQWQRTETPRRTFQLWNSSTGKQITF